jgi:hypothetical protein
MVTKDPELELDVKETSVSIIGSIFCRAYKKEGYSSEIYI